MGFFTEGKTITVAGSLGMFTLILQLPSPDVITLVELRINTVAEKLPWGNPFVVP